MGNVNLIRFGNSPNQQLTTHRFDTDIYVRLEKFHLSVTHIPVIQFEFLLVYLSLNLAVFVPRSMTWDSPPTANHYTRKIVVVAIETIVLYSIFYYPKSWILEE